jgi:hypothetical protein
MTEDHSNQERRIRHSSLDSHIRDRKSLKAPLLAAGNINTISWTNKRLPQVLWTALLTSVLSREHYMRHLCSVAKAAMSFREITEVYPDHSMIAAITEDQFSRLFGSVFSDEQAREALSPLMVLENLPDRSHWQAYLPNGDSEKSWRALADAILACSDRRAQPAIDIRWLRVVYLALQHRVVFPQGKSEEIVKMLCEYPNGSEPEWAGATIGALEMATDQVFLGNWSDAFWKECLDQTGCIFPEFTEPSEEDDGFDYEANKLRWGKIYGGGVVAHFMSSLATTDVDARHDAAFGLALYGMSLVASMMRPFSTRPSGRHLLRSLAEVCITLAYLATKDEPDLWRMYREYGAGQSKLTFLKLVERDWDLAPQYLDIAKLEALVNEDRWQELVSIDLGHWAGLNVRKMAEQAAVKDVYNTYYDWPSGFVHGHWAQSAILCSQFVETRCTDFTGFPDRRESTWKMCVPTQFES